MKKLYCYVLVGLLLFGWPLSVSAALEYNFTTIGDPLWGQTIATGVNDIGNIAGYYSSNNYSHGFIYNGTSYMTLDVPGARNTFVTGISNGGDIVGYYEDSLSKKHGFFMDESGFSTINYPSATNTYLSGINNNGDIVGYYAYGGYTYGFLKDNTGFTKISPPGSSNSEALGINDNGSILGLYSVLIPRAGEQWYSYLRSSSGSYSSLSPEAHGINNNNDIVGIEYGSVQRAFVINATGKSYFDYPNGSATGALDINNNGSIVGFYRDSNSVVRGYLATVDAPEPISSILFVTGGMLLAGRKLVRRNA